VPTSVREAGVRSTAQIGLLTAISDALANLGGLAATCLPGWLKELTHSPGACLPKAVVNR